MVDAAGDLLPGDERRFWFIDEITAITDGWPPAIKWLRDNDGRFALDTVVLTGSSAANLTEAVKALAGRRGNAVNSDRILLPMSFRDFATIRFADAPDRVGGCPPNDPGHSRWPISLIPLWSMPSVGLRPGYTNLSTTGRPT